jgi:diacylglycerol kinase (ATP)
MPDATRVLVVSNSGAGSSDSRMLESIHSELGRLGPVSLVSPESLDSFAEEVTAAATGTDLVVVAGGDGTFNCALNALESRLDELVLGLVPMGTGNDLARTLGLPKDPLEAARALVSGGERDIDIWRATAPDVSRLFVNACMGGFPVEVNEAIDDDLKRRLGPFAFWVGGAKAAADPTRYTVTMAGRTATDCVAAGVGNGRTCGGGIEVWPEADPSDGLLDGCMLSAAGVAEAVKLVATVKQGRHVGLEEVETMRERVIEVDSQPPMEFNVDGELVELRTPVLFQRAGTATVRVPPSVTD